MCKAQVELGIGDDIVWNGKFGQYKLKGYSRILSQLFKVQLWQHKKGSETSLWHFWDVLSIYKIRNQETLNFLTLWMSFNVGFNHCVSKKFTFWVTAFSHWKKTFTKNIL